MQVIIYKQGNGIPAYIIPTQEALGKSGIDFIAKKDVPTGKPFKIINESELLSEPQEQWDVDEADLTDGVGADYGAGSDWEVVSVSPLVVRHVKTGEIKEVTE